MVPAQLVLEPELESALEQVLVPVPEQVSSSMRLCCRQWHKSL